MDNEYVSEKENTLECIRTTHVEYLILALHLSEREDKKTKMASIDKKISQWSVAVKKLNHVLQERADDMRGGL